MRAASGITILAAILVAGCILVAGYFDFGVRAMPGAVSDCAAEFAAAIPNRGCAAVGEHRHGDGCDPLGPVRVTATRYGDAFDITTAATLPYRGALRVSTSVPDGVRWVGGEGAWSGEGTRQVRFELDADLATSTERICGEVRVTMLSQDGETFVDTASLTFVDGPNHVREAVELEDGRLEIPSITRAAQGGGK